MWRGPAGRRDAPKEGALVSGCHGGEPQGASTAMGQAQQHPQRGRGQDVVPVTAQVGFLPPFLLPGRELLCHHHQHKSGPRSQSTQSKLNIHSHHQHLSPSGPLLGTSAFVKVGTAALLLLLRCIFPWESRNSWEPGTRMGTPGCPCAAEQGMGLPMLICPPKPFRHCLPCSSILLLELPCWRHMPSILLDK